MEMHLQKAPKKITLKLLKTWGRFFQIFVCVIYLLGGGWDTLTVNSTEEESPSVCLLVLCSQFFLTKHQKKKKSLLFIGPNSHKVAVEGLIQEELGVTD